MFSHSLNPKILVSKEIRTVIREIFQDINVLKMWPMMFASRSSRAWKCASWAPSASDKQAVKAE